MDAVYNAISNLGCIPCTATGTNTIALTQVAGISATVTSYSSLAPTFAFLAAASASGAITININGIGAKSLYKNSGSTLAGTGDIVSGGLYLISYNSALNSSAGGFVLNNPAVSFSSPTVQRLTSGSGTYTATAGTVRQRVRMCGPGGGGGAAATNSGAAGSGDTSFQVNATGTAWTAVKGSGGAPTGGGAGNFGGAGGTGGTNGSTGTLINRIDGEAGSSPTTTQNSPCGGLGGANPFAGRGAASSGATAGSAAKANTGGGGGGAGGTATNGGGGGGAGEYVEFFVTGMVTATYSVGAGGAGGAAGTTAGGAGATGIIIIEEFYV